MAPRYRYDQGNSARQVTLTLKLGSDAVNLTRSNGIQWHMNMASTVVFATSASDARSIPWIVVQMPDGQTTTYVDLQSNMSQEQLEQLPRREMACTDCHNRTAHGFPLPDPALDEALFNGSVSPTLPSIKRLLVEALSVHYGSSDQAHRAIRETVTTHYRKRHPTVLQQRETEVSRAIRVATNLYDRAVFADAGIHWQTYPNHIGHRFSPGCFRCHDGQHVSAKGKVVANDCGTTCHTPPVLERPLSIVLAVPHQTDNWHPWQLPRIEPKIEEHDRLLCADCHGGGYVPKGTCDDCHRPPGI